MVGDDLFHLAEPVCGDLRQDIAFVGDALAHDDVEGGDAVGRDDQQSFTQIIDVTDLATGGQFQIGEIG